MNCDECEKIRNRKNLVYEDEEVAAMLAEKPAVAAHVILLPKEHDPIIEKIPDDVFGHMLNIANQISVVSFQAIGAHGTNILINNGIVAGQKTDHASIHIIPRTENDGLNIQWSTIKAEEDDLTTVQLLLKEELEKTSEVIKQPEEPIVHEPEELPIEEADENYQMKQLERTP